MFFIPVLGQEIVIGEKINLKSKILDESRELWASLPTSYSDSTYAPDSYPVMYLIDPDFYFKSMVAIREALTTGMYVDMEEIIIVGIGNTDRSRDLTPTNNFIIHSGKKIHESSGGANNFLAFISDELIPFIDSAYRTNGYSILNGHSFGGLFSLYALQTRPEVFNAYLVHEPSIWWDDRALYKSALSIWDTLNLQGKYLYLSMAYNEEKETDRYHHSQAIEDFTKIVLKNLPKNGLRYQFAYYENEDHGTIFLPASYNAIRDLYNGLRLPVKQLPEHPELIEQHYKMVSESLHFNIQPPEKLIDQIAGYCIMRKNFKNAKVLFQLNIKNYPNSAHAHFKYGEFLLKQEKTDAANSEFKVAKTLNPSIVLPEVQFSK